MSECANQQLWELCRRCGISATLIGEIFEPKWIHTRLDARGWSYQVHNTDLIHIALVRALLAQPDVLLLHSSGSSWLPSDRRALTATVRSWLALRLDNGLADLYAFTGRSQTRGRSKRTVLWSAPSTMLAEVLTKKDMALTLESESCATLMLQAEAIERQVAT